MAYLILQDSHRIFCRCRRRKLNESTLPVWQVLHRGKVAKQGEHFMQLLLGHVIRQTSHKQSHVSTILTGTTCNPTQEVRLVLP